MEPTEEAVRYKIAITKAQVVKVVEGKLGVRCLVQFPQGITLEMDLSFKPDVRVGDILTIYTEVLAHAQPSSTSIQ